MAVLSGFTAIDTANLQIFDFNLGADEITDIENCGTSDDHS